MNDEFDLKARTWDDNPERAARARAVARQIMDRVPLRRNMHVLDFGSGTGLLGFNFLPRVASVTFADPSQGMLDQVEAKLADGALESGRTLRLDPDRTVLPGRYDAIVSLMTLHHVPDPPAVVSALVHHLEPGGWLALCDLDTEDGSFHDDPDADVHHGFHRGTLVALAERLGLQNVDVSTAHTMTLEREEGTRTYPLFLLVAQRPPGSSSP